MYLIGMFGLFILIVAAAYYAARILGKHYSGRISPAKQMSIIDRLDLGRDRFLLIIQTGGRTLLVGVTNQHMQTLAELDAEELSYPPEISAGADFFRIWKNKLQNLSGATERQDNEGER